MTDLFILLAAVTVFCTGAAVPSFFKSSRITAGCLVMSVAVLAATAACFVTPVKDCFAAFSKFDIWYYSALFVAAFLISFFYRPLLGIALVLYVLWCAAFLIILLPAGYSPSGVIGEVTVSSAQDQTLTLDKITLSPYQLLPYKRAWYRTADSDVSGAMKPEAVKFLTVTGTRLSSDQIDLPQSATWPHVYSLSIAADGSASFETVF